MTGVRSHLTVDELVPTHGLGDFLALCRQPAALGLVAAARPTRSASLDTLAKLAPRMVHVEAGSPSGRRETEDDFEDVDDFDGHGIFDDYDDEPGDEEDAAFWSALVAEGVAP